MADSEDFINQRRELIKRGEGCITHMYLDTVGKVTVGVGNMLPDADAAARLSFVDRETGESAAEEEIKSEFNLMASQVPGRVASSYKQYTHLDLIQEKIDELLDQRIQEFETGLKQDFPNYAGFPDAVKLGLMDMAFNLGISGLIHKFPSFTRAVREENWTECAAECRRVGIAESRNEEVKGLFTSIV